MSLGKKALVIGLGVSGKAAAQLLLFLGYEVSGVDAKKITLEDSLKVTLLQESEIFSLKDFSLVVLSPGVSRSHPLIVLAQREGVEVVGEVELALRYLKQPAIAITGTNGKTTVTLLVEHVLRFFGKKAKALGNVGEALSSYVIAADPEEVAVIELSSYQLELLHSRVFDVGVILNITPDHLDRYVNLQEYARSKIKLEDSMKSQGTLYVYEEVVREYKELFSTPIFSFGEHVSSIALPFLTGHDLINANAAWLLCSYFGVSQDLFIEALKTFKKPSHRIEFVRKIAGVSYYDDSKGTNIDAVIKAVSSMTGSVVLIAGGVDKGSSYLPWKEAFQDKVKYMFLIGESASKIQEELGLFFNVKIVDSLDSAVRAASMIAKSGDFVLLSPGCSSFDMFCDYKQRGKEFQRFVGLLEDKGGLL